MKKDILALLVCDSSLTIVEAMNKIDANSYAPSGSQVKISATSPYLKVVDENKRTLIITPHGTKYEELCEAVLW